LKRHLPWLAVAALFALHFDFWWWRGAPPLPWAGGLPAGFVYHVAYCAAAAGLMLLLSRRGGAPERSRPPEGPVP
jgi:hypothetical protein